MARSTHARCAPAASGGPHDDVDPDDEAGIVVAFADEEMYLAPVEGCGWSVERVGESMTVTLLHQLVRRPGIVDHVVAEG